MEANEIAHDTSKKEVSVENKIAAKSKELNLKALKLPPKRIVAPSVDPKKAQERIEQIKKERLAKTISGEVFNGVAKDSVNNAFLWMLAFLPVFYMLSCIALCGGIIQFTLGGTVWFLFMNSLLSGLDEGELKRRCVDLGRNSTLMMVLAYFLVPAYLFWRGKAFLNKGSTKSFPYIFWWIGFSVSVILDTPMEEEEFVMFAIICGLLTFVPVIVRWILGKVLKAK